MPTLNCEPEKELQLNIFHLEDMPRDRKKFRAVYNSHLRRNIVKFFKTNFGARCKPALHQYTSVEQLAAALLIREGNVFFPTASGSRAGLFVLDFTVPKREGDEPHPIDRISIRDELGQIDVDFLDWLHRYFPAIPIVFLTSGGGMDVPQGDWQYISKDALDHRDGFAARLSQDAEEWWSPSFANELARYAETADRSWHTPGHNAGNAFLASVIQRRFFKSYGPMIFQTDLSVSVSRLGDLSEPESHSSPKSPLEQSRQRAAKIFGSHDTFYVTNGTSTSNKVMLQTLLRADDVVLVDRNCHKSVHQAVVMAGVLPLYLPAAFNRTLGVWSPLSMNVITAFLKVHRPAALDPKLMVITSCTYEGVLYPVGRLARLCEQKQVLLMADEAWAPHLRFHPAYVSQHGELQRYNATDAGAHVVVQSTHKYLAAFSQASMIHISGRVRELLGEASGWQWLKERFSFGGSGSYPRFKHQLFEVLRYWHSTSPHYPMLATLDRAGIQMRLEGAHLIDERLKWALQFERDVPSALGLEHIVGAHRIGRYVDYRKDPLKLVIGAAPDSIGELTGALTDRHVMWEKATTDCVEFLITIGTSRGDLELLRRILDEPDVRPLHSRRTVDDSSFDFDDTTDQVEVLPRAAISGETELRSLEELRKQAQETQVRLPICAQMVTPYPPGIPVMLPGLRVNERMINKVENALSNGEVHGIHSRNGKHYVEVMTERSEERAKADPLLMQFAAWRRRPDVAELLKKGDQ